MQAALRAGLRSRAISPSYRCRAAPSSQILRPGFLQFRMAHTKKYTSEHEVVHFDDSTGIGIVAITDHAQSVLGDVVFVELPAIGTTVSQGDAVGAVESVKAASDIYAPISGTVEEINETLSNEPGLLNKSAEDKGWLFKIKLSDPAELDKLMTQEEYKASIES